MPATIPHRTDLALARAIGPIRPSLLRVHEPESPESIYLREQARLQEAGVRLKDSRATAERYHEARERGLETEAAK